MGKLQKHKLLIDLYMWTLLLCFQITIEDQSHLKKYTQDKFLSQFSIINLDSMNCNASFLSYDERCEIYYVLLLVTEARYPRANFSVQVWQLPLKCFPDIIVTP